MNNRLRRNTKWYVVNIKSRDVQTPQRYIDAFTQLNVQDPLVLLRGSRHISIKSFQRSQYLDCNGYPRALYLKLSAYDILNPDAFYNRRQRESVSLQLDPDIVANEKETEIIFVPSVHRLAFRTATPISLSYIVKYFSDGLSMVDGEGHFDVHVVKDHDVIERILMSHEIFKIDAVISYSNADPSLGFHNVLDNKLRRARASRMRMTFEGTREQPLQAEDDGMIAAIVGISESNGCVEARVRETENANISTIKTKDYPLKMDVQITDRADGFTDAYNELVSRFGNNS